MKAPRIFIPKGLRTGDRLRLEGGPARHIRVLRLRAGNPLVAFDGRGGEYAAELLAVDRRHVDIRVGAHSEVETESPLSLTLIQAVSKGERMDWTLQKAVELGVQRLVPVFAERSVVNLDGARLERRMGHWRGVVESACEQCGRNRLPELLPAEPLAVAWQRFRGGQNLVLDTAGACRLGELGLDPHAGINLLIGPEGGLTGAELAAAREAGFRALLLGPRVLRTETAGIAALAALQSLWGDLG